MAKVQKRDAEEFVVDEPLIVFACYKAIGEGRSPYDAVRYAWRLNVQRAQGRLVLASNGGVIAGAYRPNSQGWIPATVENFPNYGKLLPGLFGFHGTAAEAEVWNKYVDKAVPTKYRLTFSFRYCDPEL